jgi:hypothetical protein
MLNIPSTDSCRRVSYYHGNEPFGSIKGRECGIAHWEHQQVTTAFMKKLRAG